MIKNFNSFIKESVGNKGKGPGNNDLFNNAPKKQTINGSNPTMDFLRIGKHIKTSKIDGFIDSIQKNIIYITDRVTGEVQKHTLKDVLKGISKNKEEKLDNGVKGFEGTPLWATKQKIYENIDLPEDEYIDDEGIEDLPDLDDDDLDIEYSDEEEPEDDFDIDDDDIDIDPNDENRRNKILYGTEDNPEGLPNKAQNRELPQEGWVQHWENYNKTINSVVKDLEEDDDDLETPFIRGTEDNPIKSKKKVFEEFNQYHKTNIRSFIKKYPVGTTFIFNGGYKFKITKFDNNQENGVIGELYTPQGKLMDSENTKSHDAILASLEYDWRVDNSVKENIRTKPMHEEVWNEYHITVIDHFMRNYPVGTIFKTDDGRDFEIIGFEPRFRNSVIGHIYKDGILVDEEAYRNHDRILKDLESGAWVSNIEDEDNYIKENIDDNNVSNTLTVSWFKDYFNQRQGRYVDTTDKNIMYLQKFREQASTIGYDIVKEYDLQGVHYIQFNKPLDQNLINLFNKYEKIKDNDIKTNENILPKPCNKVRCLECGEEVCDSINHKVGHLYNRHNCKPSVGDYKAKKMLKEYFK